MGIIQSIIRWVLCCFGSVVGSMAIFCWTHMLAPASTGSTGRPKRVSGRARSIHRNVRSTGTTP